MAKLPRPRGHGVVFSQLRLPAFLDSLQAPRLLPYGELALAALLLLLPDGWYVVATTLALVLFSVYLVVVVRALGFGYPITCGCFGKLGLGWITRQTAVRNAVLLAVAAIAWVDSWRGEGVLQRLTDLGTDGWWLAGVVLAVVTTALVVRESKMPPLVSLPTDEYVTRPIPYLVIDGPEGPGSLWRLSDTAARLLVFWDPTAEATADLPACRRSGTASSRPCGSTWSRSPSGLRPRTSARTSPATCSVTPRERHASGSACGPCRAR